MVDNDDDEKCYNKINNNKIECFYVHVFVLNTFYAYSTIAVLAEK